MGFYYVFYYVMGFYILCIVCELFSTIDSKCPLIVNVSEVLEEDNCKNFTIKNANYKEMVLWY